MKKTIFCILLSLLMIGMFTGCAGGSADPMAELLNDPYGDYRETGGEIAFVFADSARDGSYNEAIYEGIQMYAQGLLFPITGRGMILLQNIKRR